MDRVRKVKELKAEDARLGRAVSELILDKMILTKAGREAVDPRQRNFRAPRFAALAANIFDRS